MEASVQVTKGWYLLHDDYLFVQGVCKVSDGFVFWITQPNFNRLSWNLVSLFLGSWDFFKKKHLLNSVLELLAEIGLCKDNHRFLLYSCMGTGRTRISSHGSHTESSSSTKTSPFQLSLAFLNREGYRPQRIEIQKEFIQLFAGIQKFTSRTRVFGLWKF